MTSNVHHLVPKKCLLNFDWMRFTDNITIRCSIFSQESLTEETEIELKYLLWGPPEMEGLIPERDDRGLT